jgi:hypothetical protein
MWALFVLAAERTISDLLRVNHFSDLLSSNRIVNAIFACKQAAYISFFAANLPLRAAVFRQ